MTWYCRNKRLLPLVATAAATLFAEYVILIVSGQSSVAGFINIDCGKGDDYSYADPDTGLVYTSDFQYIETGEIRSVDRSTIISKHSIQAHHLRSFPTGARNCYIVQPVEKGSKYLVKASFMYGNYDGKDLTPRFDLYLGVNFWTSMYFPKVSSYKVQEIITVTTSHQVSVCLVNTGSGTPFISALELRPLPPHLYDPHLKAEDTSTELVFHNRTNFAGNFERYPQDPYDRSWFKEGIYDGFKILTTKSLVESRSKRYVPPTVVMKTAICPGSSSSSIYYCGPSKFVRQNSSFLLILHFAELQELKENETRIFDITINDLYIVRKYFSPSYLVTTSIYAPLHSALKKFSICRASNSTLPPIINAIEVFQVRDKTETETSSDDLDAATAIKVEYKVKKNWVGDPCSPINFMWDGLKCRNEGFMNLRIVSINLSSSGLNGEISASFANLSQLRYLNLSGNELTGGVPDALESLAHLQTLDLSRNRLNGYVPGKLLERSHAGILTLRIDSKSESTSSSGPVAKWKIIVIIIFAVIAGGAGIACGGRMACKIRTGDETEVNTQANSGGGGNVVANSNPQVNSGGGGNVGANSNSQVNSGGGNNVVADSNFGNQVHCCNCFR